MIVTTLAEAAQDLDRLCNGAVEDQQPVLVKLESGATVVIVDAGKYEQLSETAHRNSLPQEGARLLDIPAAADFLNVSQPYLIQLLESRALPHQDVGACQRIKLADLMAYKEHVDQARLQTLQELAAQAQELAMGY